MLESPTFATVTGGRENGAFGMKRVQAALFAKEEALSQKAPCGDALRGILALFLTLSHF